MHRPPTWLRFAVPACLLAGLAATDARAQSDPSTDQIINSLRPGTGMGGLTRGIRPVGPAAPAEPAETAAPGQHLRHHHAVAQQVAPAAAPSVNLTIDFETNSAQLSPDAVHTLDHLGQALSSPALANDRFRIEGHTDTVGSPAANTALSARRAAAVADYMVQYFHVGRDRLQPVGMGEAGLLVPTPPQTAEARNRRVEVVNLGG